MDETSVKTYTLGKMTVKISQDDVVVWDDSGNSVVVHNYPTPVVSMRLSANDMSKKKEIMDRREELSKRVRVQILRILPTVHRLGGGKLDTFLQNTESLMVTYGIPYHNYEYFSELMRKGEVGKAASSLYITEHYFDEKFVIKFTEYVDELLMDSNSTGLSSVPTQHELYDLLNRYLPTIFWDDKEANKELRDLMMLLSLTQAESDYAISSLLERRFMFVSNLFSTRATTDNLKLAVLSTMDSLQRTSLSRIYRLVYSINWEVYNSHPYPFPEFIMEKARKEKWGEITLCFSKLHHNIEENLLILVEEQAYALNRILSFVKNERNNVLFLRHPLSKKEDYIPNYAIGAFFYELIHGNAVSACNAILPYVFTEENFNSFIDNYVIRIGSI